MHSIPLAELWVVAYSKVVPTCAQRSKFVPNNFTKLLKPHCYRYTMTPTPRHHPKGCGVWGATRVPSANHVICCKKIHIFKPCDLDTARSKIDNVFPDESVLPQLWVHPTFGVAYHSGETVLLALPVSIPTLDTDTVTLGPAAWNGEGITTCWLKHNSPDARRVNVERKKTEAASDPLPEPQVRVFFGSTVVVNIICVLPAVMEFRLNDLSCCYICYGYMRFAKHLCFKPIRIPTMADMSPTFNKRTSPWVHPKIRVVYCTWCLVGDVPPYI